jgi:hypothetical protein
VAAVVGDNCGNGDDGSCVDGGGDDGGCSDSECDGSSSGDGDSDGSGKATKQQWRQQWRWWKYNNQLKGRGWW